MAGTLTTREPRAVPAQYASSTSLLSSEGRLRPTVWRDPFATSSVLCMLTVSTPSRHRVERRSGSFPRTVTLPSAVQDDKVDASEASG